MRELGIGFVAYSPLGRGFLTGADPKPEDLDDDDFRRHHPRFQGENFQRNLDLVERVEEIAAEKGVTPGQLALAWVLAQGDDVVPIPGTKRRTYLEENVAALEIELSDEELPGASTRRRPPAPRPARAIRTFASTDSRSGARKRSSRLNARRCAIQTEYGPRNLDRRHQLRARQRARQALQRDLAQDGPLPPAVVQDGARIRQKRVDPSTGDEVAFEDIVKGYELTPDRYVLIEPEELDALDPKATKTIDIEEFVDLAEIDPIYYDHSYYLAPTAGGAKAYRLLLDAMREAGKVAIGRVVLRSKQQLCCGRPTT